MEPNYPDLCVFESERGIVGSFPSQAGATAIALGAVVVGSRQSLANHFTLR